MIIITRNSNNYSIFISQKDQIKYCTGTILENIQPNYIEYSLKDSPTFMGTISHYRKPETVIGEQSVTFGYNNSASATYSCATGENTSALGKGSHTEGCYTNCTPKAFYSHHEGLIGDIGIDSNGNYYITNYNKQGNYGCNEIAAHAEGVNTYSSGLGSHSEGVGTRASVWGSHAEGDNTQAAGIKSHAEGANTRAMAEASHAEGESTEASANGSHAEGYNTRASKAYTHAEGFCTSSSGSASHSEGWYTTAKGDYSHASGYSTVADNTASFAIGTYNKNLSTIPTYGDAFVIGNGTSNSRSNGFRVTYDGNVYAKNNFNSSGADYAEFFEWYDKNPKKEDRVGYFVTLEGAKIKIADSNSEDILGIVSGNPSVIGNSDEEWVGRYLRDIFDRYIIIEQMVDYPYINDNGKEQMKSIYAQVPLQNSNYNSELQYQHRKDRPEWDTIGLIGVLPVREDGSCLPNKYCQIADGGIATLATDKTKPKYRVLERISNNVIKVMFR